MRVKVKTLSPVHVGSGERFSSLEWIIQNGRLKVYKFDRIVSAIESLPLEQQRQNAYLWFKNNPTKLADFMRSHSLKMQPNYELEINGAITNTSAVDEFIKTLEGPYLPGSELKGAIRHLIACHFFMKSPGFLIRSVQSLINQDPKNPKIQSRVEKELEGRVFYPQDTSKDSLDAKNDLMKVVVIPDSQPFPYEYLRVEVPELINSNKRLYPCEALKEGVEFEMEIRINKNTLDGLKRANRNSYALMDKFSTEETFWEFLVGCSEKFYSELLDEEIAYFKNRNQTTVKHLQNLKSYLGKGLLLRLGKHEGILSTTLLLIVKKQHKQLFDEVFRATQHRHSKETNKTRRTNRQGLTFGWVVLERL